MRQVSEATRPAKAVTFLEASGTNWGPCTDDPLVSLVEPEFLLLWWLSCNSRFIDLSAGGGGGRGGVGALETDDVFVALPGDASEFSFPVVISLLLAPDPAETKGGSISVTPLYYPLDNLSELHTQVQRPNLRTPSKISKSFHSLEFPSIQTTLSLFWWLSLRRWTGSIHHLLLIFKTSKKAKLLKWIISRPPHRSTANRQRCENLNKRNPKFCLNYLTYHYLCTL